jgi:hypothetical protein
MLHYSSLPIMFPFLATGRDTKIIYNAVNNIKFVNCNTISKRCLSLLSNAFKYSTFRREKSVLSKNPIN